MMPLTKGWKPFTAQDCLSLALIPVSSACECGMLNNRLEKKEPPPWGFRSVFLSSFFFSFSSLLYKLFHFLSSPWNDPKHSSNDLCRFFKNILSDLIYGWGGLMALGLVKCSCFFIPYLTLHGVVVINLLTSHGVRLKQLIKPTEGSDR